MIELLIFFGTLAIGTLLLVTGAVSIYGPVLSNRYRGLIVVAFTLTGLAVIIGALACGPFMLEVHYRGAPLVSPVEPY